MSAFQAFQRGCTPTAFVPTAYWDYATMLAPQLTNMTFMFMFTVQDVVYTFFSMGIWFNLAVTMTLQLIFDQQGPGGFGYGMPSYTTSVVAFIICMYGTYLMLWNGKFINNNTRSFVFFVLMLLYMIAAAFGCSVYGLASGRQSVYGVLTGIATGVVYTLLLHQLLVSGFITWFATYRFASSESSIVVRILGLFLGVLLFLARKVYQPTDVHNLLRITPNNRTNGDRTSKSKDSGRTSAK